MKTDEHIAKQINVVTTLPKWQKWTVLLLLSIDGMFFILRVIRTIFGVIFATQVLQILEAIVNLAIKFDVVSSVDIGKYFALVLLKVIALGVFYFLFNKMRSLINYLYEKKHGILHPTLGEKKWNL